MSMKRKCRYCGKYYDISEEHNCKLKQISTKKNNRIRQKKFVEEHKDTEGYKIIHSRYWQKFRKRVIAADHGYCQRCKIKFNKYTFEDLEVHHIIPRTDRPDLGFDPNNVVTVCKSCNDAMGTEGIDFQWNPKNRGELFNTSIG